MVALMLTLQPSQPAGDVSISSVLCVAIKAMLSNWMTEAVCTMTAIPFPISSRASSLRVKIGQSQSKVIGKAVEKQPKVAPDQLPLPEVKARALPRATDRGHTTPVSSTSRLTQKHPRKSSGA